MSRFALTDTHDPADAELLDRQDEDARAQQYAEFVQTVTRWGVARAAFLAAHRLTVPPQRQEHLGELDRAILDFQQFEGWSGVFAAIARALREQGQ